MSPVVGNCSATIGNNGKLRQEKARQNNAPICQITQWQGQNGSCLLLDIKFTLSLSLSLSLSIYPLRQSNPFTFLHYFTHSPLPRGRNLTVVTCFKYTSSPHSHRCIALSGCEKLFFKCSLSFTLSLSTPNFLRVFTFVT